MVKAIEMADIRSINWSLMPRHMSIDDTCTAIPSPLVAAARWNDLVAPILSLSAAQNFWPTTSGQWQSTTTLSGGGAASAARAERAAIKRIAATTIARNLLPFKTQAG